MKIELTDIELREIIDRRLKGYKSLMLQCITLNEDIMNMGRQLVMKSNNVTAMPTEQTVYHLHEGMGSKTVELTFLQLVERISATLKNDFKEREYIKDQLEQDIEKMIKQTGDARELEEANDQLDIVEEICNNKTDSAEEKIPLILSAIT